MVEQLQEGLAIFARSEQPGGDQKAGSASTAERILVVADDPERRQALVGKSAGYSVLASDGGDALDLCQKSQGGVDLVITEAAMPCPLLGARQMTDRTGIGAAAPVAVRTSPVARV